MVVSSENVESIVHNVVNNTQVVDLHTHLFPFTHDDLFVYGIDELLTYHYLIAEFFAVASNEISTEVFFSLTKQKQADLIWYKLFIQRSPISEACLGVLTVLKKLGLDTFIVNRDLQGIRSWYAKFSPEEFESLVFTKAKVRYAVMTNIPFDPVEAKHWMNNKKVSSYYVRFILFYFFFSALRVDALLSANGWDTVSKSLVAAGFPASIEGAREYLRSWIKRMNVFFFEIFFLKFFFLKFFFQYPSPQTLLVDVIIYVAREQNLAVAMKIGADRCVNPCLHTAGDGVEVADLSIIKYFCQNFP
eukprot:GSMAST32.ASY1.ANO1.404.1 assembled CDS